MKIIATIVLFLGVQISGFSQVTYILNPDSSSLKIHGTSSVHDWTSNVEQFDVEITLSEAESANINIETLTFEATVKSIKSGKRIMDRKTRGALKEGDYPTIQFVFQEFQTETEDSIDVIGMLSMAGATQEVSIYGQLTMSQEDIIIRGTKTLLMSDFDISPPKAMAGTLKTGNEVEVEFEFFLTKK